MGYVGPDTMTRLLTTIVHQCRVHIERTVTRAYRDDSERSAPSVWPEFMLSDQQGVDSGVSEILLLYVSTTYFPRSHSDKKRH